MLLLLLTFFLNCHCHPVIWVGGVTSQEAQFRAMGFAGQEFVLSLKPDLSNPGYRTFVSSNVAHIQVGGLHSDTRYYYGFPKSSQNQNGTFQTFVDGPWSFKITFGSTASSSSNAHTWQAMLEEQSQLFIHMGDLHCDDIQENNVELFRASLHSAFDAPLQRAFYHSVPVAYIWDDLDFGKDSSSPAKTAALTFYEESVPRYPLPNQRTGFVSPYQAWTIGNVRFVMPDLRSEAMYLAEGGGHIMSSEQMDWFLKELSNAHQYSVVVFVSSREWIGRCINTTRDGWGLWPEDRKRISNFIASHNITNLVMIAGNARMLAFDDGSHSDYSDAHEAGFPVIQSGPLDRWGEGSGGPYVDNCYGSTADFNEAFGIIEFKENNGTSCIRVSGVNGDAVIIDWEKCVPFVISGQGGDDIECDLEFFPSWTYACFALSLLLTTFFLALGAGAFKKYFKHEPFKKYFLLLVSVFFSLICVVLYILCPVLRFLEGDSKTRPYFLPSHTVLVALAINCLHGGFLASIWTVDLDFCTPSPEHTTEEELRPMQR